MEYDWNKDNFEEELQIGLATDLAPDLADEFGNGSCL